MTLININIAHSDQPEKVEKDKKRIKKLIKTMPTISFQHMEGCGPCEQFMPIWDKFVDQLPKDLDLLVVKLESAHMDNSVLPNTSQFPNVNASPKNTTEQNNVQPHEEALENALQTLKEEPSPVDTVEGDTGVVKTVEGDEEGGEEKTKGGGKRKKRKTKKNRNKKAKRKFTRKPQKYKSKTFKKKYSYKKVRFASKKKYRKTPRY